MTPGDVGIVAGNHGLSDGVIGLATRSPAHHVFIVVRVDPDGTVWIVEAAPSGARMVKLAYTRVRWVTWPGTETGRAEAVTKAILLAAQHVGYNWLDIAALGLAAFKVPMHWAFVRLDRTDKLICSQLTAVCWACGGVSLWPVPAAVTPAAWLIYDDGL